jgi:hypothetical protein
LWVQVAVLAGLGVTLFVAPATAEVLWPWELTALTSRTIAAWLLTAAVAAYLLVREHTPADLEIPAAIYTALPVLLGLALPRFRDQVAWDQAAAPGLVVLLVLMTATGLIGLGLARREEGARVAPDRTRSNAASEDS